jgi:hypothetical protein
MSYYKSQGIKPNLFPSKLKEYYRNKIMKEKVEYELNGGADNGENKTTLSEPIYNNIKQNIIDFAKENYGFILFLSLIIILLYVRYIEVSRRKDKIKILHKQLDLEDSEM